jgi:soluble lytic murein transglycosylase-like protein
MTTRQTRDSFTFPIQTITQAQFDAFTAQKAIVEQQIADLKAYLVAAINDAVTFYDYQASAFPSFELNSALYDLKYINTQLSKPIQG